MGPKDVADELGASKGDAVVSEKRRRDLVVKKASSKADRLEEIMDWNPSRTGKIAKVTPKVMKEIWKG
jgi:bifunctional DNA-binding transcriptional regulator/antitoxin component of YhaV-PrlF toxin-antitoxin module